MRERLRAAAIGLAVGLSSICSAEEIALTPCSGTLTRRTVAACALASSPALGVELASVRAGEGRREAARPILPSNPALSGTLSSRSSPTGQSLNWSVGLSQELEISGQRGLRLEVAEGELRAQAQRVAATRAAVAEAAWLGYFRAIAARERLALAIKSEIATQTVAATVRGMATAGLTSEVDADVAEAVALRASQDRLKAEEQLAVSQAQLRFVVGGGPVLEATGDLEPLKGAAAALQLRPELLALREEQAALGIRVDLLRRTRLPNPTLSLFAQNDGLDERVLGVGLSIPIPLPQPVGRTLAGDIAEGAALADRAGAAADRMRRELQVELEVATAEYESSTRTLSLYTPERAQRASARLESIAAQVKAARVPVRDVLVAQQALVEQLKSELDAREAACAASVRLTRAAGLSLEGGSL